MSLSYTVGNWTVASHEVDTISTTKNIAVPDLDYAHDFSVAESGDSETKLLNVSGAALEPCERLRYAKERVADIYRYTPTLKTAQLPSPVGARVLAESTEILSAANSVSGADLNIPIRVWTCIESSTHNAVTGAALLWALKRHIASLLATGAVDEGQLVKLFRGDLDPTK
jgi:hypothetical protein